MLIPGSGEPTSPPMMVSPRQNTAESRSNSTKGRGSTQPIPNPEPEDASADPALAGTGTVAATPSAAKVNTNVAPQANRYIQNGTGNVYGTTSVWAVAAVGAMKIPAPRRQSLT